MYARAATTAPGPRMSIVRSRYRTPSPAKNTMLPSQMRCAIQLGKPTFSMTQ